MASLADAAPPLATLNFMTADEVRAVRDRFGTPTYVYDLATLRAQADAALAFPNEFGLTVRFAMKASPNAAVLRTFAARGLHIDASSGYEVHRALAAGIPPARISLSSQELPADFAALVRRGVEFNACSLAQLDAFGAALPGAAVGVRFNPGEGSGGTQDNTNKTNVGGPDSSFGIWHEHADAVAATAAKHGLRVVRVHTHIGSGSDPAVWQRCAGLSLALCRRFEGVATLNLGGGYKVARVRSEKGTDLQRVGAPVRAAFAAFAAETGRKLRLEVEPGTFLVCNAGALVTRVQDRVTTFGSTNAPGIVGAAAKGPGHTFLKLDSGMTEIMRPSLYGAQHPIVSIPAGAAADGADGADAGGAEAFVVVGHCCESGDLLTPAPGEPEVLAERRMRAGTAIGDLVVVEGAGVYCSSMSAKNYNSFPEAAEVMRDERGGLHLIRRRQTLAQIMQNEVALPDGL